MQYLKLTLTLVCGKPEEVAERLSLLGFSCFEIEDYSDLCDEQARRFYDYIDDELLQKQSEPARIHFYFSTDPKGKDEFVHLLTVLKTAAFSNVELSMTREDDAQWKDKWKEFFVPFGVGKRLFILPPWSESVEIPKGRERILMDPSAAFGSGTHATTRLCLEFLEDYVRAGETVLDVGCGSGILAIAALKLGAKFADAVDVDEAAVAISKENLEQNGISKEAYRALCADAAAEGILEAGKYQLVFANLVASLICQIADRLYSLTAQGGILIASGILSERKKEVSETLKAAGFVIVQERESEEWCALAAQKQ